MYKHIAKVALLSAAALMSGHVLAVTGGGATLPAALYKGSADSILPASFSYVGVGSGAGKAAFLSNNAAPFGTTGTVHFTGSDSILTASEIRQYQSAFNASYGPLIQLPSVGTAIAVSYKKSGISNLNLTSSQLCWALSGEAPTWGHLMGTADTTPIRVVYRNNASGTSEILTRHLNSVCPTKFSTSSLFTTARQPSGSTLPSNWVGVSSDRDVLPTINQVDGSIGYSGPDGIVVTDNAVVARINGVLPTVLNVALALSTITPPSTFAHASDPTRWSPVVASPASGYKIVAFSNLIIGQCYKDANVANEIRNFLTTHYSVPGNNAAVLAHKFLGVLSSWKNAVTANFITNSTGYNLDINNPSVCNGIGRPL
ncbi:Phosphate-binding DING protein (related to PstS) [Pseudomonas fluorescens]|nr:Phosphate-binding DING protein (related to PstS) [Pseudomonas fluorescens]